MKAYVVRGTRTVNGKSETVWLAYHREAGGEYQWTSPQWGNSAHPFKTISEALAAAKRCPGPWFNEPAKDTIKVLNADYEPPREAKLVIHETKAADSVE